jgi:hypothetical protein
VEYGGLIIVLLSLEWYYSFLLFIIGIFYINGPFTPSYIINTTFQNVYAIFSSVFNGTYGGVLYVNMSGYNSVTLERCIFSSCRNSRYGGVLYLNSSSPFTNITRCRFENNSASYGHDIYVDIFSCFSKTDMISDSCTTSTWTASVYCSSSSKAVLTSSCEDKIVLSHSFFFFFFLIFINVINEEQILFNYLFVLYNFVIRIGVMYQTIMRNVQNFV